MNGQDNDQKSWEKYLSGNSELSREYNRQSYERAPEHLDKAILKASRESMGRKPRILAPFGGSWVVPASLAAVLVITIAVVPLMQETLRSPEKPTAVTVTPNETTQDTMAESKSQAKKSKPLKKPLSSPAPMTIRPSVTDRRAKDQLRQENIHQREQNSLSIARKMDQAKMEQRIAGAADKSVTSGLKGATATLAKPAKPAEDWLKDIKQLLELGKKQEAEKSFQEFRKQYPNYPADKILGTEYKNR